MFSFHLLLSPWWRNRSSERVSNSLRDTQQIAKCCLVPTLRFHCLLSESAHPHCFISVPHALFTCAIARAQIIPPSSPPPSPIPVALSASFWLAERSLSHGAHWLLGWPELYSRQKLQPSQPSRSQPASPPAVLQSRGARSSLSAHWSPPSPRRIHIHLCLPSANSALSSWHHTLLPTHRKVCTTSWLGTKVAVETFRSPTPGRTG